VSGRGETRGRFCFIRVYLCSSVAQNDFALVRQIRTKNGERPLWTVAEAPFWLGAEGRWESAFIHK